MSTHRFPFEFEPLYRLPARALGITDATTWVEVDDERFVARFGPWRVETARSNVRGVGVTGPYGVPKTIGPAHLSLRDRGLTFATNRRQGACITFKEPVTGIDPVGLLRHPGLTVTVADPDGLLELLTSTGALRTDVDLRSAEQAAHDELHTMTASELRSLAASRGISHPASLRKAELVALLEDDLGDDLVDELA